MKIVTVIAAAFILFTSCGSDPVGSLLNNENDVSRYGDRSGKPDDAEQKRGTVIGNGNPENGGYQGGNDSFDENFDQQSGAPALYKTLVSFEYKLDASNDSYRISWLAKDDVTCELIKTLDNDVNHIEVLATSSAISLFGVYQGPPAEPEYRLQLICKIDDMVITEFDKYFD